MMMVVGDGDRVCAMMVTIRWDDEIQRGLLTNENEEYEISRSLQRMVAVATEIRMVFHPLLLCTQSPSFTFIFIPSANSGWLLNESGQLV